MSEEKISTFMREWRKKHGLHQWQLARLFGIKHPERISMWESGNHDPQHPLIIKWALYGLGVALKLGLKKPTQDTGGA